jgi:hypothetical protein
MEKKEVSKSRTSLKPIEGCYTWRQMPLSTHIIEQWTEELRAFPDQYPQAKTLTEFMTIKEIYKDTFYRLVNRNKEFKAAYEHTKLRLGERLWANAVDNKANWKAVHHRLYRFDKEFQEDDAYHVKLAKEKNEDAVAHLVSGIIHSNKDKIHESNT